MFRESHMNNLVRMSTNDDIAVITIDRQDRGNSLDYDALTTDLPAVGQDTGAAVPQPKDLISTS